MYALIRALLFRLDPETAHEVTLRALDACPAFCFKTSAPMSAVHAMGLTFPHPLGLAAGLDKNGEHLTGLSKLGFSFLEIGTVTPLPQAGNPKPRLFRLPQAQALINKMGFNNHGLDALVNRLQQSAYSGILGINVGKNKDTLLENAADDYVAGLKTVYPYASYVTVNISSPNTPGLRVLQQEAYLETLLKTLVEEQMRLAQAQQHLVPLVLKISPDESEETVKRLADKVTRLGIAGIIATNTTAARPGIKAMKPEWETGGLSGRPLAPAATQTLRLLKSLVGDAVTLIAAGGIDSPAIAKEKLQAGASLLQVYTGLIYQGPGLVSKILHSLG